MQKLAKLTFMMLFIGASIKMKSQQEAQFSLYFFNPMLVNPGYTGSQEALSVTAIVRDQWTNFDGAPKTQGLTIHTPLRNQNIGVGLSFNNDKIGANNNTASYGYFAYSIKLNSKNHRLVFGVKAGADYFRSNYSNVNVNDNTDNLFTDNYNYRKTLLNVGAGAYYYGKRFFLGCSSPQLLKNSITPVNGQKAVQENHFYAFGGLVFKINSAVNFRPSFVVKSVKNAPLSVDVNTSFLFYDKLWIGAMYRYNSAVGGNVMYNISDKFRIGYAYDFGLNNIQRYSVGSHEIMLSYDLRSTSKGIKSPRYF